MFFGGVLHHQFADRLGYEKICRIRNPKAVLSCSEFLILGLDSEL